MESPKAHPVDLNTPGLPKPYRELRSLINFLSLGLFFGGIYFIFLAWTMAASVSTLNIAILLTVLATLVSLFLCRRGLVQQKKRAAWFLVPPIVLNIGYLLITPGGFSNQNLSPLLVPTIFSVLMSGWIATLIKQGLLL